MSTADTSPDQDAHDDAQKEGANDPLTRHPATIGRLAPYAETGHG